MKKALSVLVLFWVIISMACANDVIASIKMSKACSYNYVDNPTDEGVIVEFYQTDELYNKVRDISNKYFPDEDFSKLVLVGFDTDGSLNDRSVYASTISGTVGDKSGHLIHLSMQLIPDGINDKNFEWIIVHELIHVYTESDVTHTKPESIKLARQLEQKFGFNLHYGNNG